MLLLTAAFLPVCFRFRSDEAAADDVDLSDAETDESESELSEEWRSDSASLNSAALSRFFLRLLRSASSSSAAVLI